MRILTFSPYSFINVHAYPEAIVADNFRQRGHSIVQVRCKGLYRDFCISMSAAGLTPRSTPEDRQSICDECSLKREAIEEEFGFETLYIDDFVDEQVVQNSMSRLKDINQHNWTTLTYDGIPIPRYASYEYVLNEKINTTEIAPELWDGFLTHAKNAFITAEAGAKLLEHVKPDALLSYNSVYSCNHVMCCLAEQRGIPHYTLHAGAHHKYMRSQATIFKGLTAPYLLNRTKAWQRYSKLPLSAASIHKVEEHIYELFEARSPWVYTTKSENKSSETLRDFFGISERQKVLLVTMASGDERFAITLADAKPSQSKEPLFESQIAWIHKLVEWAKSRDDVFLIVRVHPRDFPNKREKVLSQQAALLRSALSELPHNAKVNWPEDSLSLHDIAKITDVCLNATSTAGLELLLLGIPTVIHDTYQLYSYPPNLNLSADSVDEYFSKIDDALAAGKSAGHVIDAFRWLAFKFDVVAMDISEAYSATYAAMQESQTKHPHTVVARIKDFLNRIAGRSSRVRYRDPHFNSRGLQKLRHGEWLAYAVEHRSESHIEALCDIVTAAAHELAEEEFRVIAAAARKYFNKIGISDAIFNRIET